MSKRLVVGAVVSFLTGCNYGNGAFSCTDDNSCGAGGKCEPDTSLCSFADTSCPSGRKYGDLAGGQSGKCVDGGGPPLDAGLDSGADAPPPDALVCYGTGIVQVCFANAPTQPLTISNTKTIDTGTDSLCATNVVSGGANYCVVVATTITISATLRATGPKPLVLVASDSISVPSGGSIDVGSHRQRGIGEPETGAGADVDTATCVAGTPPTNTGGGAGGSFTGKGGTGGKGTAANAGTPADVAMPPVMVLRGGCPGQDGKATAGSAGHGGGAVFLIATNKIDIGGNGINAGGEAGGGGALGVDGGGGGGGGAGGMIGLDAQTVMVTSSLVANGGGGGEGGSVSLAVTGQDGTDATTTNAAPGGNVNTASGGDGGDGSAGPAAGPGMAGSNGGKSGANFGGGGGGGGGAGLIKVPAGVNLGNKASPAPTP